MKNKKEEPNALEEALNNEENRILDEELEADYIELENKGEEQTFFDQHIIICKIDDKE